jgi:hypothetical protein
VTDRPALLVAGAVFGVLTLVLLAGLRTLTRGIYSLHAEHRAVRRALPRFLLLLGLWEVSVGVVIVLAGTGSEAVGPIGVGAAFLGWAWCLRYEPQNERSGPEPSEEDSGPQ